MFQVPMKMVIMSGSGCSECLFFICCRSWQKPSLFCGLKGRHTQKGLCLPARYVLKGLSRLRENPEGRASQYELPGEHAGDVRPKSKERLLSHLAART